MVYGVPFDIYKNRVHITLSQSKAIKLSPQQPFIHQSMCAESVEVCTTHTGLTVIMPFSVTLSTYTYSPLDKHCYETVCYDS